ncbi:peptidase S8/S53 domain-containing protein [Fusarium tricinctum]|uniref:Peptidase S8/S53 domain-containing protein n=1 Tax=Fusarium tricinctum TaxID=61284 RepID=A0A8K0RRT8_9HYPO|nr:peptidase S8/S53 domain-containing protein [Fusarium tricinctum]
MVYFKTFAVTAITLLSCTLAAPTSSSGVDSAIPGSYIITLKQDIIPTVVKAHMEWVGKVHQRSLEKRDGDNGVEKTYETEAGFRGYSGTFDPATIKQIKNSPEVASVEPDRRVELTWNPTKRAAQTSEQPAEPSTNGSQTEEPTDGEESEDDLEKRGEMDQKNSTWGLATISHRKKGFGNYIYSKQGGASSFAYVVDSGVRVTHQEFQGRAKNGWTAFKKDYTDRLGHGTHVAGIIIGKTFGVAKRAKVISVKVFQGNSADLSVIMNGIEWAVNDIIKKKRQEFSVVNLSLGIDSVSSALNDMIQNAAKQGVIFVVAAGNQGEAASTKSPASASRAITVGAINRNWKMPEWSNYGSSVDILAPGVGITSASWKSDNGTYIEDGTSMACPHVSGLVLYAQSVYGITGVETTTKYLKKYATANKVSGSRRGSPNRIANNNNLAQSK